MVLGQTLDNIESEVLVKKWKPEPISLASTLQCDYIFISDAMIRFKNKTKHVSVPMPTNLTSTV